MNWYSGAAAVAENAGKATTEREAAASQETATAGETAAAVEAARGSSVGGCRRHQEDLLENAAASEADDTNCRLDNHSLSA